MAFACCFFTRCVFGNFVSHAPAAGMAPCSIYVSMQAELEPLVWTTLPLSLPRELEDMAVELADRLGLLPVLTFGPVLPAKRYLVLAIEALELIHHHWARVTTA